MQAGKRTGIEQFLHSRHFPLEITAYMMQGEFKKTRVISDKLYTKKELHKLGQDPLYKKHCDNFDALIVNPKTLPQFFAESADSKIRSKQRDFDMPELDSYKYKFIMSQADVDLLDQIDANNYKNL